MIFAELEETNNNLLESKVQLENTVKELITEKELSEKNRGTIHQVALCNSIPVLQVLQDFQLSDISVL